MFRYTQNAQKVSVSKFKILYNFFKIFIQAMLADKPPSALSLPSLEYGLKLVMSPRAELFALKAAQKLNFLEHYCLDFALLLLIIVWLSSR